MLLGVSSPSGSSAAFWARAFWIPNASNQSWREQERCVDVSFGCIIVTPQRSDTTRALGHRRTLQLRLELRLRVVQNHRWEERAPAAPPLWCGSRCLRWCTGRRTGSCRPGARDPAAQRAGGWSAWRAPAGTASPGTGCRRCGGSGGLVGLGGCSRTRGSTPHTRARWTWWNLSVDVEADVEDECSDGGNLLHTQNDRVIASHYIQHRTFQRIIRLILNLTISTYSTMTYRCLLGRLPAGWMEGSARTAQGEVCDECSLGSGALRRLPGRAWACLAMHSRKRLKTFFSFQLFGSS